MKRILMWLLFVSSFAFAENSAAIFAGMRNSHYAFIGFQSKYNVGVAFENSLNVQKVENQYGRFAVFYGGKLPLDIFFDYSLYVGMRYDQDYYDFGSRVSALYKVHERFLHLKALVQPFYDSDYKGNVGYLMEARTFFLPEVALFANFKNIPEFRNIERRVSGGLIFETDHLSVMPEISTPINGDHQLTRVSVSFLYKLPI